MKMFQRILAVALVLIMSLSLLGTVAFADTTIDTTKTGSITIHKYEYNGEASTAGNGLQATVPSGAEPLKDVEFTIYQVMDAEEVLAYYNGSSTDSVTVDTYVTNGAINSGYSSAGTATTDDKGVATFSNLNVGMYVVIETSAPDKVTQKADPFLVSIPMTHPTNLNEWLYDVHAYPKNSTSVGSVTIVKEGENQAKLDAKFELQKKNDEEWTKVGEYETGNTGSVVIADLTHGDYQLIEQSVNANGYIVDKTSITFTVNQDNTVTYTSTSRANVTASTNPAAAITLTVTNEKPDVTKTASVTNAAVDQNVDFTVTVEVPANITALKQFALKDEPTNLEVNTGTIKVYDGSTEVTDFFTCTKTEYGFTLTFTPASMATYAGKTLTVKYTAKVLSSAATSNESSNKVTLTYDDNVRVQSAEATATQKNYKISIVKYKDSVADSNKAADVEFELYSDAALTQKVTVSGTTGNYIVGTAGADGTTTTLVTGTDGKLVVSGLAAGTYYLKETKAPNGYNLLSGKIEITLNDSNPLFDQNVINKAGFTLPTTGGLGTLMFIIIGGVMIAGGICLITVPGKKRAV